ncbi:MAG: hypothetical protein KJ799_16835 [Bacteroidetes bacterium]|nr:hypothetical protein [Bacteroidota bacterium]MBU1678250.1 hypothetical protein [Bacteroidota bacterium]MBU2508365.1 hypothetical protein [Bacteroidota bacterium]
MRKFLIGFFSVLLVINISAQVPDRISDTLDVVTTQDFNVPGDKNILMNNVISVDVSAEILDASGNSIKQCENIWQFPSRENLRRNTSGGRGETVQIHVTDNIDAPGTYYMKVNLRATNEDRRTQTGTAYYMLNVKSPASAAPTGLRTDKPYFFSEKLTFSFATVEFKDATLYSYEIQDAGGNAVESGKGAVVKLDAIFSDAKNVNKNFTIVGFYNGKEFLYTENGDPTPKESKWTISLRIPALDEFGDFKVAPGQNVILSTYNPNARRILYTFVTQTADGGFVMFKPDARNFQMVAEPSDAITNQRATPSSVFLFVTFDFNPTWLESLEQCSEQAVKISIRFRDQFGETRSFEYQATVLN